MLHYKEGVSRRQKGVALMNHLENLADSVKSQSAKFMLSIGATAVSRSFWPLWQHEPEMPQSMLDEINNE